MILEASFACILGLFCFYSRSLLTLVHTSALMGEKAAVEARLAAIENDAFQVTSGV